MEWSRIDEVPVDNGIKELLKEQGIDVLYPPQADALPHALNGDNVVLSVPTASGKTLVAYLAILDAALRGKKSLYIVPLRALAAEKWEDLQPFRKLGIRVGISTGDLDNKGTHLAKNDIVICTSEKADSLLRHGASWLNDVGIVIADEIHLINDPSRGPTLEMVISRLQLMNPELQIIALSATIQNAGEIAGWLDARLVQSDWRPVPLKEGVLYKNTIYFLDESTKEIGGNGKAGDLVTDILREGGQALVFVNSRRSAQTFAEKLKDKIPRFVGEDERKELRKIKKHIISSGEKNAISERLADCVENGVAFHHAGLSNSNRKTVEDSFKKGILKCIVATPTLAAGVNTPARRVIIKDVWRYSQTEGYMVPIPVMEVKQAMGRAGRPGYDAVGEAVLVAKNDRERQRLMYEYLTADVEPVYSKLGSEPALRIHILALIATKFAVTWDEIVDFLQRTFYARQMGYLPEDKIDEILSFLEESGFIAKERTLRATLFGKKTSDLYIDPLSALKMREALEGGSADDFSYLHAICSTPDMRCIYVSKKDDWIEEKAESKKFLTEIPPSFSPEYEWFLAEVKTASMLEDWINEVSEDGMIQKYQVGPGDIHNKVETAEWLLHAMQELARIFDFGAVPVLTKLIVRMRYGCREELLNLVQLRGIGRVRARALYNAGFTSVNDLRKAGIEEIARVKHVGKGIAKSIKEQVE